MQPNQPNDPGSATVPDGGPVPAPQPAPVAPRSAWMAQTALFLPLADRTEVWRRGLRSAPDALVAQRVVAAVAGLTAGIVTGLWLLLSASPAPAGAAKPAPLLTGPQPTPLQIPGPAAWSPPFPATPSLPPPIAVASAAEPTFVSLPPAATQTPRPKKKRNRGAVPPPVVIGRQPKSPPRILAVQSLAPPPYAAGPMGTDTAIRLRVLDDGNPPSPPKTTSSE